MTAPLVEKKSPSSDFYQGSGLQTNIGSAFTLLGGEYGVELFAASTDWSSTGIAELQMLGLDGATYIGLGGTEVCGKVKTTAANSYGVVKLAPGSFKVVVTAPAANVQAVVARIAKT